MHHVYGDTFQLINTLYLKISVPIPDTITYVLYYKKKRLVKKDIVGNQIDALCNNGINDVEFLIIISE